MSEICKDCYQRLYGTQDRIVMSDELELCEECGNIKPVVVKVKPPIKEALSIWWDNLGYWLREKIK